ncbi:hypothetical protein KEM54_000444 [Ascosphaera aggregata]|nr:hypothetical protein KEM54_000444 [Ascosphaera aggregata]
MMKSGSSSSISSENHQRVPFADPANGRSYEKGPTIGLADKGSFRHDAAFVSDVDFRHHKPAPGYEGLHRWDPEFTWSEEEEDSLVRKVRISELPRRLSFYWTTYAVTQIIGAFLAYGFLHVHLHGRSGWRYLVAFEGLITGVIGLFAAFYLPSSPSQTKGVFNNNGWFNEREEKFMVNRILRDDPGKGDMHNRQTLSPKLLLKAFGDYDLFPVYLLGFTWGLPPMPSQSYITLQLKSLGFGTFQASFLTIPAYSIFIIQLLFFTWLAERTNQRMLVGVYAEIYNLACCIALRRLPDSASPWSRWALSTLLIASPYVHACMVALASRNAGSVRTRTVATALYNMTFQASSIIGINVSAIYPLVDDKPYYRRGNTALIGVSAADIALFLGARYYYIWRNRVHKKYWDAMTPQEKDAYVAANKDKGNKRYDFRDFVSLIRWNIKTVSSAKRPASCGQKVQGF